MFIKWLFIGIFISLGSFSVSTAEEYPVFDGRYYNSLFYPRIDVIEWGEPTHVEFQVYQKDKPVNIVAKVIESGSQKILLTAFEFPYRGERLCRRIVAPPNFKVGQKLHYHFDSSDKDMNNIIVSPHRLTKYKPRSVQSFEDCTEVAAHSEPTVEAIADQSPPDKKIDRLNFETRNPQELKVFYPMKKRAPASVKVPIVHTEISQVPHSEHNLHQADGKYDAPPKFEYHSMPNEYNWFQ